MLRTTIWYYDVPEQFKNEGMNKDYEVIIIGGSYAGLAAALALGRALRNVLIIDSGQPCNRQTPHSHNFLTQDGETPQAISAKAKEQVLKYSTVNFLNAKATQGIKTDVGFEIGTDTNETFTGKKLLFAAGIKDIMPQINGFAECWGISVIHCPYCHGYEVKGIKTAIMANGDAAYHYCVLLSQWTNELTVFTNGKSTLTPEQFDKITAHSIEVIETDIDFLNQTTGRLESIVLKDGSANNYTVMYSRAPFIQHSSIAQDLGCAIDENGFIIVDDMQKTNIPGLYTAGDCSTMMRSVAMAVAAGMKSGAMINHELSGESF
jgi:thioredoxin reductase